MSSDTVDKIARAVLYEGYVLYPYRPCVKTRQRWTFGGIFPAAYSTANDNTDPCILQTQVLVATTSMSTLSLTLRFLHLMDRIVQQAPDFHRVESLRVGATDYQSWQEAVEREIHLDVPLADLLRIPLHHAFTFPAERTTEDLHHAGHVRARLIREQQPLEGIIDLSATALTDSLLRITARISNLTPISHELDRDHALLSSFASTHLVLHAPGAQFISLTDPPAQFRELAASCENTGCWPVLAGESNQVDTLLVSPIILPDYPQIAPESPGDLFDGCEIDEILTLRILTLTDAEKEQAVGVDPRVRALMERTETLARDQLMNLHGALRTVTPTLHSEAAENLGIHASAALPSSPDIVPWDPFEEHKTLEKTLSAGIELSPGDRVTLRPKGRADIMDLALAGKTATIAAIEQDFENRIHLAVTVDEDPGADFGIAGKPGHRFFFKLDEVEVLERRVI